MPSNANHFMVGTHYNYLDLIKTFPTLIEMTGIVEREKEQTILQAVLQIFSQNEPIWIANSNTLR